MFTGNAFVTNGSGTRLGANGSVGVVPEPSTWAIIVVGAGLTGLVTARRRPPHAA